MIHNFFNWPADYKFPGIIETSWSNKLNFPSGHQTDALKAGSLWMNHNKIIYGAIPSNVGYYVLVVNQTEIISTAKESAPFPSLPTHALALYSIMLKVLDRPIPVLLGKTHFYLGQEYSIVCNSFTSSPMHFRWEKAPCLIDNCNYTKAQWQQIIPSGFPNATTSSNKEDFFHYDSEDAVSQPKKYYKDIRTNSNHLPDNRSELYPQ